MSDERWQRILREAEENGWELDREAGELCDDDDEYSHDSNKRRKRFREEIASIRGTVCASPPTPEPKNNDATALPGLWRPDPAQAPAAEDEDTGGITEHEAALITFNEELELDRYTPEWVEQETVRMLRRWCPDAAAASPLELACANFSLSWDGRTMPATYHRAELHKQYKREMSELSHLMFRAMSQNEVSEACKNDLERLATAVGSAYTMLIHVSFMADTQKPEWSAPNDAFLDLQPVDKSEQTKYHTIVEFLLKRANEYRYRKDGEWLFRQVTTHDGTFVHTYEKHTTIEEFIYRNIDRFTHPQLWQNFCKEGNTAGHLATILQKCNDGALPRLVKDRYVHSFRNGVYFVKEDRFHAWTDGPLDKRIVACKFHGTVFHRHPDHERAVDFVGADNGEEPRVPGTAWDIPTPMFDRIMVSQRFPYLARVWLYVMIGRLLYWAKDMDNWQVWMFHYGRPSVGKSTICQIFGEYFYEKDDIGSFGNQIEKQFGLWAIHDKYGVTCSEVSKDFNIDRTELQQMISAERISVRGKNLKATSCDFRAPGILAGNYIPSWKDPQGAMSRRMLIWHYDHEVKVDNELMGKIALEIPRIILKCNRFYRAAVDYVGTRGLWNVLPQYFHQTRMLMQSETSTIHGFLRSEDVVIRTGDAGPDKSVYVPASVLKDAFTRWKQNNEIRGGVRWAKENYARAFSDLGISQPTKCRKPYPRDSGQEVQQMYIFGIDLAEEVERLEQQQ